jgi:AraC-like DNA-binding protein
MLYQSQHSLDSDHFKIEKGKDFSFPPHLHESFELIAIKSGEMTVDIEKRRYFLRTGEALLVFPNQLHALYTEKTSEHILCIFSPHLVKAYGNIFTNQSPKNNFFIPTPFYLSRLDDFGASENLLGIKGLLYSLCDEFNASAEYTDKRGDSYGLLPKIFKYVEENYKGDCSVSSLAADISYHEVYLSRYFKKHTGLTFSEYVNRYRVNEGAYILKNSQKKIVDVAYECGFESLRSFNRNFKAIVGKTPNQYRNDKN